MRRGFALDSDTTRQHETPVRVLHTRSKRRPSSRDSTVDDSGEEESDFIVIVGPTPSNTKSRADITLHARDYVPPPETELAREIAATALSIPYAKSVLIKNAHCWLFWPGEGHTLAWTKAQIGVWALQRPWIRSPEDEAWVWTDCLVPVLSLSKAGRQALDEDGSLGYEFQLALLRNYVNPLRPGGFQRYIRQTVNRVAARQSKTDHPTR